MHTVLIAAVTWLVTCAVAAVAWSLTARHFKKGGPR